MKKQIWLIKTTWIPCKKKKKLLISWNVSDRSKLLFLRFVQNTDLNVEITETDYCDHKCILIPHNSAFPECYRTCEIKWLHAPFVGREMRCAHYCSNNSCSFGFHLKVSWREAS